jgi:hypothetical protein
MRTCPYCGEQAVSLARGLHGGKEFWTFVLLFPLFFIPAIIYYIRKESVPWCSSCGRRVPNLKRTD